LFKYRKTTEKKSNVQISEKKECAMATTKRRFVIPRISGSRGKKGKNRLSKRRRGVLPRLKGTAWVVSAYMHSPGPNAAMRPGDGTAVKKGKNDSVTNIIARDKNP